MIFPELLLFFICMDMYFKRFYKLSELLNKKGSNEGGINWTKTANHSKKGLSA